MEVSESVLPSHVSDCEGEDEGVLGGEIFTGDTVRKKEKGVQGLE